MTTFGDTGVWFASIVPTDPRHQDVADWHRANNWHILTADYVVDETLTLLRARGERTRAVELGRSFFDLGLFAIHRISDQDLHRAHGEPFGISPSASGVSPTARAKQSSSGFTSSAH